MLPAWPAGVHALVSRGRSAAMAGSGRLLEQATYMDACVTLSSAVHGLLLFIQLLRSLCYQALIPGTTCLTLHLISNIQWKAGDKRPCTPTPAPQTRVFRGAWVTARMSAYMTSNSPGPGMSLRQSHRSM